MNKHKYSFLKLLNFLSGFFLSLLYAFVFLKRKKRIIFSSTNNNYFIFNSKSLFVDQKLAFEAVGFEVFFVITDPIKRAELNKKYPNAFISNQGLKNKLFILRSAIWIVSTLDLPVSGVFLARKRFVYHLGHGTPIKNIGLMEVKCSFIKHLYYKINSTNVSLFLSTSSFFQGYMSRAFGVDLTQIVIAPQPRVDSFLSVLDKPNLLSQFRGDDNTKLVLYCPTWRPFSGTKLFPFEGVNIDQLNSFLADHNTKILLRLHPLFEGGVSEYAKSNIIIFDTEACPEISDSLIDIDALITDYSSIYCDYYLLDRPVAFIPYDLAEYTQEIGFSFNYKDLTSDCYLDSLIMFEHFIKEVSAGTFDVSKQIQMKERFNYLTEQSARQFNYDLILAKYKELF